MFTNKSAGKDVARLIFTIVLITLIFVLALYAAKALVDGWPLR